MGEIRGFLTDSEEDENEEDVKGFREALELDDFPAVLDEEEVDDEHGEEHSDLDEDLDDEEFVEAEDLIEENEATSPNRSRNSVPNPQSLLHFGTGPSIVLENGSSGIPKPFGTGSSSSQPPESTFDANQARVRRRSTLERKVSE